MNKVTPPANEKLAMLDEHGHRQFIIPAEVRGFFNSWKKKVHVVLLFIFLILPWITINGHQAVLIDIPQRQFFLFGMHLMAYDTPLIFFILVILTVGLALMTALYGRVWCGWACPQTVFIEGVYRQIEKWTEGNYIQRRRLQQEGWSVQKIRKTGLKWILFAVVSSLIAHSFIAYWTGGSELLKMMSGAPSENRTYFLLVTGMTALLLFNFGWFREQFCIIMCPYGKFQSVLMDSHSVTVMYDEKRGEPRKNLAKDQPRGDCVSCQRCVQVCPTGIDIRNGIQMECIGCTACIDACDEIMTKVKKSTGLIRYKALKDGPVRWFRSRVIGYSIIIIVSTVALGGLLYLREPLRIEVLRGKDTPYLVREESQSRIVQNHFKLRIENNDQSDHLIQVQAESNIKVIIPQNPLVVKAGEKVEVPLFIEVSLEQIGTTGKMAAVLRLRDIEQQKDLSDKKVSILGPLFSGGSK